MKPHANYGVSDRGLPLWRYRSFVLRRRDKILHTLPPVHERSAFPSKCPDAPRDGELMLIPSAVVVQDDPISSPAEFVGAGSV